MLEEASEKCKDVKLRVQHAGKSDKACEQFNAQQRIKHAEAVNAGRRVKRT